MTRWTRMFLSGEQQRGLMTAAGKQLENSSFSLFWSQVFLLDSSWNTPDSHFPFRDISIFHLKTESMDCEREPSGKRQKTT